MTELIDNPPPLPDFHVPCWLKHGPYEESEPLSCVFENPSDADCFSALTYLDDVEEKYRAGEAAAFARGVAAKQAEIDELKNDLSACNAKIKKLEQTIDGLSLGFAGAKQ